MYIILIILVVLFFAVWLYMQQNKFGKSPGGVRLKAIKQSPHFKNGQFQNINLTPNFTNGYNFLSVVYRGLFVKVPNRKPTHKIPSVKTDLKNISLNSNVLVWFGHSSYFMQIDGKRFLIDPVFSGYASPIKGLVKAFDGANDYTVSDIPAIDYLVISHDHYDHLDYETIIALKQKVNTVICGLGVGSHFEHWGYNADTIIEKDWYEKEELGNGFVINVEPARHFSGRTFKRNNTLWVSYVLQTPSINIYIGGDSGYDAHYAAIGNKYNRIDLAIIDNGQYDNAWEYIHNHPHQAIEAIKDLKATHFLPVHSSKFALANHDWREPLNKINEFAEKNRLNILTPKIGELVYLNAKEQVFERWWLKV